MADIKDVVFGFEITDKENLPHGSDDSQEIHSNNAGKTLFVDSQIGSNGFLKSLKTDV